MNPNPQAILQLRETITQLIDSVALRSYRPDRITEEELLLNKTRRQFNEAFESLIELMK
jgi:acetolactate synthase small subunit